MNITLRAGEKIYINGAVIRVDRKVAIELMNDVTFLLEHHVIQANEATTPLRQIYFAVQVMLMDPIGSASTAALAKSLVSAALNNFQAPEILIGLKNVSDLVERSRHYEALKVLRGLYPLERREMFPDAAADRSHAA